MYVLFYRWLEEVNGSYVLFPNCSSLNININGKIFKLVKSIRLSGLSVEDEFSTLVYFSNKKALEPMIDF